MRPIPMALLAVALVMTASCTGHETAPSPSATSTTAPSTVSSSVITVPEVVGLDVTVAKHAIRDACLSWKLSVVTGAHGVNEDCSFTYRALGAALRWDGETFATEVLFVEPGNMEVGLLGRLDFFNTFNVSFTGWRETPPEFEIEHYPRGLHLA